MTHLYRSLTIRYCVNKIPKHPSIPFAVASTEFIWMLSPVRVRNLVSHFEGRAQTEGFRPKRQEDGSWRKLHNDELHSLCY
jgi:hypothetical protein